MLSFDDRDGVIWIDGHYQNWRESRIHVLTHSLHYGSAVFEGVRVYDGVPFKLHEHNERLRLSASEVGYEIPYTADDLNTICRETLVRNKIRDGYIRPFAWRGAEQMGISAQSTQIHVAVAAWAWGSYFPEDKLNDGIRLCYADWRRPPPESAPYRAKVGGLYVICTMAKHAAENAGFDDAMMLDTRGYLAESTGTNLFMVKDGVLHTPEPDCFLDGITRRTVMDLARARGIEVVTDHYTPDFLEGVAEVFLTGTAAEVTPVGQVGDLRFNVGPVTRALRQDYMDLVRGIPITHTPEKEDKNERTYG